jgi:hypothetical protein
VRLRRDRTAGYNRSEGNQGVEHSEAAAMTERNAMNANEKAVREKMIRDVREEMRMLESMVILLANERGDQTAPIFQRTIGRLQAIESELKKGLKG